MLMKLSYAGMTLHRSSLARIVLFHWTKINWSLVAYVSKPPVIHGMPRTFAAAGRNILCDYHTTIILPPYYHTTIISTILPYYHNTTILPYYHSTIILPQQYHTTIISTLLPYYHTTIILPPYYTILP